MARYAYNVVIVASLLLFASAAWAEQYFIYSPKSVQKEEAKQTKDGILVRSVPVQNGDSLYSISQKITGRGMYYPQILLFNDIKNPSDIRPGDNIRVPVPKDSPVAEDKGVVVPKGKSAKESVKEPTVAEVKKASADKGKPAKHHAKTPARHKAKVSHVAAATTREPSEGQSGSSQLAELAISEGKPLANTGKKKRVATQSEPIINTRKPLRGENSWKEKPLAMKRQPMTEEEVRPSAAMRQAELRQAGRIPMSPDEIRPVLSATSFQDVETAYQYRA
ncbi:MAG: LysM domain-containing protein, partial [Deltaproteobacteria bacterium]